MNKYKVMLSRFPGGASEHPESSDYYIKLYEKLKHSESISEVSLFKISDTPITMGRNRAVRKALEQGVDYLLMMDSDLHPDLYLGLDPNAKPFWDSAWDFMMKRRAYEDLLRYNNADFDAYSKEEDDWLHEEHHKDAGFCTIAAPYCGPPPLENVYVFLWRKWQNDHPNPDFSLQMYEREEAARFGGISEVAALPTGLILYDTRIFKRLPPPWFDYEYTDEFETEKATTEDVYQTRNQSMLKMPCYCNWDAWAGHIKSKTVGRPLVISADDVHASLVNYVQLNRKRGEKLMFIR